MQLNPEAVENVHAATQSGRGDSAQALGYTGAGVKVGFIADGIDPDNPDLIRPDGQHVIVAREDFSGSGINAPTVGLEAFLDSGSIAAQGRRVYSLSGFSPFRTSCRIRILGVAPGASLVGLMVFGPASVPYNSELLEAIDYAVTVAHVRVLNESFGSEMFPDDASLDLVKIADDAAVRAGVTVTVASGDSGPTNTIGSPASDPEIISAGASTSFRAYAQTGIQDGLKLYPLRGWIDDNISGLSSSGFTQDGTTVNLVAPGDQNWQLCTPDQSRFFGCGSFTGASPIQLGGGTSESAPLTAGVAALVIQAYARTHHGKDPSPAVVKQIIVSTAQDIGAPAEQQGAGLLDAYQAVQAAVSYPGGTRPPAGHAVLDSATALHATGQPGTAERFAETLTNDGRGSVTIGLASRTLSPYRAISTRTLTLTSKAFDTRLVRFRVGHRLARLSVSVALHGPANVVGPVSIYLIAPDGKLAGYDDTQGLTGNFGNAQVASPAAGTWTALVNAPSTAASVRAQFQASTATWHRFGTLSARSLTLAQGASARFTLTAATPPRPGDLAGSIVLHSSAAGPAFTAVTSVPVTLRSLVPAPDPAVSFTGTLTGGNGRLYGTGQTAYYQLALPPGRKAISVQVGTGDPRNTLLAELIDPAGDAAATAVNGLAVTTPGGKTVLRPQTGAQLHVLAPRPGLWTLIVDFYNAVSGTAVAQPFKVTISDIPPHAAAPGLPDSPGRRLVPGKPFTVGLRVRNNGTVPEAYFVDARLRRQVTVALAAQTTSTPTLPDASLNPPLFLVPSQTTAISARVSAARPVYFDYSWIFGDPDLISSVGRTATGRYAAAQVADGDWAVPPFLAGPFGTRAPRHRRARVSMTATTAAFDPAVSSPTGDLWLGSTDATAGFTPYVVNPGQAVTIPVTITPEGTPGSQVSGTIYLDDSSIIPGLVSDSEPPGGLPEGNEVAAFPYRYTIG